MQPSTNADNSPVFRVIHEPKLQIAVRRILFDDAHPHREEILQHWDEIEEDIVALLKFFVQEAYTELSRYHGFTQAYALITAQQIVLKIALFSALYRMREQGLTAWYSPDHFRLSSEDKLAQRDARHRLIYNLVMLEQTAYAFDQDIDQFNNGFVRENLGQSEPTAITTEVNLGKTIVDIFPHLFYRRLDQLADLVWEFDNPIERAVQEGLTAYIALIRLIETLKLANFGLSDVKDILRPLGDVLTYELIAHLAWDHGRYSNVLFKFPFDFREVALMGGEGEGLPKSAREAVVEAIQRGQGTEMVAYIHFMLLPYVPIYDEQLGVYRLVKQGTDHTLSVADLLGRNQNLRQFVSALRFMVRASDDVGDAAVDYLRRDAANIFLADAQARQFFLDDCQRIDAQSGTDLKRMVMTVFRQVDAYIAQENVLGLQNDLNRYNIADALKKNAVRAYKQLWAADNRTLDLDAKLEVYKQLANTLLAIAIGAIEVGTTTNDEEFTDALRQQLKHADEENSAIPSVG